MNFGDLAYTDIEARHGAVHLLPLGATEPHGPHAPLSTDTLISTGICRRVAERLRGEIDILVLPPLPYGVTRYGSAFPGALSISEGTLRALVEEITQDLRPVVLVNSHFEPEQVATLRESGLPLLDLTRRAYADRLTEEFRSGSCHAGRYETSLVLADHPELVNRKLMAGLETRTVDMPTAIGEGRTDFLAMGMDAAYCGSPAEATPEEGVETYETLTDMLVELVREVAAR